MPLRQALQLVAQAPRPETLDSFRRHLHPDWIQQALKATGTASLRRRRLPAEQVLWLVLGMALFRDRSIVEVVDSLDLALPGSRGPTVARSAITPARDRLGAEPLRWLFHTTAEHWAHASADRHRWRGLALYGVDGTSLRLPDSPHNRAHFGAPSSGAGDAGYPQLRLAALCALRSHLLVGASFGPYRVGEGTLARELWPALPDHSLCIVDRNFLAATTLIPLAREGTQRHWLIPAKKNTRWRELERRGRNDLLVEMKVSSPARRQDPSLPRTWIVRAIRYQRRGFKARWLLTSLLHAEVFPAREVVAMYHQRWEIELAYGEIKRGMLEREETIRSRSPERVRQEVWGILLAYNLIRLEMEKVAHHAGVVPMRISFIHCLHLIRDEFIWSASAAPGAIPRHLRRLRDDLQRYILPVRRSERSYPRAVKIRISKYPQKKPTPPREDLK